MPSDFSHASPRDTHQIYLMRDSVTYGFSLRLRLMTFRFAAGFSRSRSSPRRQVRRVAGGLRRLDGDRGGRQCIGERRRVAYGRRRHRRHGKRRRTQDADVLVLLMLLLMMLLMMMMGVAAFVVVVVVADRCWSGRRYQWRGQQAAGGMRLDGQRADDRKSGAGNGRGRERFDAQRWRSLNDVCRHGGRGCGR